MSCRHCIVASLKRSPHLSVASDTSLNSSTDGKKGYLPPPQQSWDDSLQSVRDIDVAPLLELKTEDNSWLVDLEKQKTQ